MTLRLQFSSLILGTEFWAKRSRILFCFYKTSSNEKSRNIIKSSRTCPPHFSPPEVFQPGLWMRILSWHRRDPSTSMAPDQLDRFTSHLSTEALWSWAARAGVWTAPASAPECESPGREFFCWQIFVCLFGQFYMAVGWLGNFLWWGLEGDEVNIERNFLTHLFSATNSQRVFEVARGSHVLLFPPRRRIDIFCHVGPWFCGLLFFLFPWQILWHGPSYCFLFWCQLSYIYRQLDWYLY